MDTINKNAELETAFIEETEGKRFPLALMTVLLIIGVIISYAHNTTPAPFFDTLFTFYQVNPVDAAALMNLTMSIIYPAIIIASLSGASIVDRIGTRRLYITALALLTVGILLTFPATGDKFYLYLIGRVIYGFGFGFGIPAMGSAIMVWYKPKARNLMTTFNGIYPLFGALLCYGTFPVAAMLYGRGDMSAGWQFGAGFTGYIVLAVLVIWVIAVRKDVDSINRAKTEAKALGEYDEGEQAGVFRWLLKIRNVRLIMITFACDFTMYAYLATILPFWLMNAGGLTETQAGVWAAIAFPVFGVVGVALGGIVTNALGKRKLVIVVCQVIKLIGLLVACLFSDRSYIFIILGTVLFGIGNGGWMPAMFLIPTELPGTNAARVGGGFSLFLSTGYVFGFLAPIAGGLLTTVFANNSGLVDTVAQLNYGYKWGFFILSLSHILAIVTASMLRGTDPNGAQPQTGF